MKAKIFQKKENNKSSSFEMDIKTKDAQSLGVSLSSLMYNDFDPDMDDYEQKEISIKKSDVKFTVKGTKGKLKIVLESANIEFDIDNEAQSERFMDKDWETETVFPTLKITDKNKKEEFIEFNGGDFFTLEMVYQMEKKELLKKVKEDGWALDDAENKFKKDKDIIKASKEE